MLSISTRTVMLRERPRPMLASVGHVPGVMWRKQPAVLTRGRTCVLIVSDLYRSLPRNRV